MIWDMHCAKNSGAGGTIIICAAHKAVHLILIQVDKANIALAVLVENIINAVITA